MKLAEYELLRRFQNMIEDDKPIIEKFEAMDRMFDNDWDLPEGLNNDPDVYKVVDSAPSDSMKTAITTFSGDIPDPSMQPMSPHPRDKERADFNERNLRWQYHLANNRSETDITMDGMESSLRYSKMCIQIIHLPTHFKAIGKAIGKMEDKELRGQMLDANERRMKMALRNGNYLILVRNPKNVHHRYSEIGLECVLLEQKMTADEIISTWGDLAKQHIDTSSTDWAEATYIYYDYVSYYQRAVAIAPEHGGVMGATFILNEDNKVGFISWAIRGGGSGIVADPKLRYQPFLNNVYTSGSWERMNILYTITMTEALAYRFFPRYKDKTADGHGVGVDYKDKAVHLMGNEDFDALEPARLDAAVMEMADRARAAVDAQTGIRALMNPDFPAGTAFATINALLKTALNGLMPWRRLAEKCFADMYRVMLYWVEFTGEPLLARGLGENDYGEQYAIRYSLVNPAERDFDPNYLYLDVDLTPDLPVDKVEQANVGAILYNQLEFPLEEVYNELGIEDPQRLVRARMFEEALKNEWTNIMKTSAAAADLKIQMMAQQMQQMMQMSMSMQQGGGGMGQPPGPPPQGQPPPPALQAMQGQGFDTAQGGTPAAMGFPMGTREMLAGEDMAGEEMAI